MQKKYSTNSFKIKPNALYYSPENKQKMEPIGAQIAKISIHYIQSFYNSVKPMDFHCTFSVPETDQHGKTLKTISEQTN
jgi:hypothetical protein